MNADDIPVPREEGLCSVCGIPLREPGRDRNGFILWTNNHSVSDCLKRLVEKVEDLEERLGRLEE